MSRRAELLASRIEEGAAGLAAFADKLSEEEWKVPMALGNDRRPVGTIVHHVATMYPLEVDLARAVAAGQVPDVTWDAVADVNANHAREVAGVSKAAALELLRKNSREAAAAVRNLTDEELDRAAPLPLYYGAPVTAQLVIEDHALRHSWHHLFRIRAALEQASQPVAEKHAKAS
jgi:DinB family protein